MSKSNTLAAELKSADDVAEWLSDACGSAAEVVPYRDENELDCVQISFGERHVSLPLPLTAADVLYYYGLLVTGGEGAR